MPGACHQALLNFLPITGGIQQKESDMKKMNVLGLSLACLLPFAANAADVCLQVNPSGLIFKFKKPAVPKNGAATFGATFIAPAVGSIPVMAGFAEGSVLMRADGTLDYLLVGSDVLARAKSGDEDSSNSHATITVSGADKKTFGNGVVVNAWVGFYEDPDGDGAYYSSLDERKAEFEASLIDCKTLPVY